MPDGEYPFIQARYYTPANRSPEDIMYIVIHDMEAPEESLTTAEGVGNFFNGPNSSRGSAHYGIDQDSIVQYVEDHDIAWGAPNVNNNGLHFEHAGYARQTRDEWLDEASMNILKRSAVLTRRKADASGIQLKHLSDDELAAGDVKGFIGHADASRVLGGGDHWDPGPEFPWDVYMNLVNGTEEPQPTPGDDELQPSEWSEDSWARMRKMTEESVAKLLDEEKGWGKDLIDRIQKGTEFSLRKLWNPATGWMKAIKDLWNSL